MNNDSELRAALRELGDALAENGGDVYLVKLAASIIKGVKNPNRQLGDWHKTASYTPKTGAMVLTLTYATPAGHSPNYVWDLKTYLGKGGGSTTDWTDAWLDRYAPDYWLELPSPPPVPIDWPPRP
jgi:hypothetical protein